MTAPPPRPGRSRRGRRPGLDRTAWDAAAPAGRGFTMRDPFGNASEAALSRRKFRCSCSLSTMFRASNIAFTPALRAQGRLIKSEGR